VRQFECYGVEPDEVGLHFVTPTSPTRRRRLVLVTYQHPPMPFLGGDPWGGLATQLRRQGHDVWVVTTGAHGDLPNDATAGIVRTPDLTAARALRQVLRRPAIAREGRAPGVAKPPPALLTRVIVPDAYLISWAAWAVPRVRELVRRRQIDCVITTSPPESVHLVALALGRHRPAWVADLRDGWTFEGLRAPFPTAAQRRLDALLERQVATRADQVTAATLPLVEDLRSRHGCDAALVPNAWDSDLEPEVRAATPPALEGDRVNLVYTGTLAGVRGHDDRALLRALRRVVAERPDTASRLRLVIAGRLTDQEARVFAEPDLAPVVRVLGALDRPTAVALQRRADALLLVTSNHRSIVTGKLFEYLTAGKPVLALAGDNEAARIVRATGAGDVVAPDDVDAIVEALARAVNGSLTYAPHGVEQFTYESAAEVLRERIEAAIESAQARFRGR
jgi:glycosyltransferase involved in cell wall biosynthesis